MNYSHKEVEGIALLTSMAIGVKVGLYYGTGSIAEANGYQETDILFQVMLDINEEDKKANRFWWDYVDNNKQWFESPVKACLEFISAYADWLELMDNNEEAPQWIG